MIIIMRRSGYNFFYIFSVNLIRCRLPNWYRMVNDNFFLLLSVYAVKYVIFECWDFRVDKPIRLQINRTAAAAAIAAASPSLVPTTTHGNGIRFHSIGG